MSLSVPSRVPLASTPRWGASFALLLAICTASGCAGLDTPPRVSGVVTGKLISNGSRPPPRLVYLDPQQQDAAWQPFRGEAQPVSLSRLLDTRLALVRSSEQMRIANDTAVIHRIFSRSNRNPVELEPLAAGSEAAIGAFQVGEIRLYCALHPWEDATLIAAPSRWAALVDPSGSFRIEEVSEGSYRLMIWDGGAIRGVASLKVVDGATVAIDLPLGLSSEGGTD
jgi:hypothetical protein